MSEALAVLERTVVPGDVCCWSWDAGLRRIADPLLARLAERGEQGQRTPDDHDDHDDHQQDTTRDGGLEQDGREPAKGEERA